MHHKLRFLVLNLFIYKFYKVFMIKIITSYKGKILVDMNQILKENKQKNIYKNL